MAISDKIYYCIDCNRPIRHKGRCISCQGIEDRRVPNVAQAVESWYNGNITDTKEWLKHCTKEQLLDFAVAAKELGKTLEDIKRLLK
jgi:hypothetical protein